jgi:hypothetical protein
MCYCISECHTPGEDDIQRYYFDCHQNNSPIAPPGQTCKPYDFSI